MTREELLHHRDAIDRKLAGETTSPCRSREEEQALEAERADIERQLRTLDGT